jgi:acyl-CoA thioesterase FadM
MLVYAGAPHGVWGMTAKVRYWLRRPIPLGQELTLRSRLVQRSERSFRAVVSIHLPGDVLAADGEGMCVIRETAALHAGPAAAG